MQRRPREHNERHLRFVRSLPCVTCGNDIQSEAAHIKFSDLSRGKRNVGVGEKASDCWTLPLCGQCHRDQHKMSERAFWDGQGIDPLAICERLYAVTGDFAAGLEIVAAARQ